MLDHSQCLPWCQHLITVQDERAKLALQVAKLRHMLAQLEREITDHDIQIQLMKAAGANA